MTFFQELKRRNVFRVAILYIVAAWLLLQIADVAISLLDLPDWAGRFVFLLVALGAIPALLVSWLYELTPDGLKREHEVADSESITHETGRKINVLIGIFGVVIVGSIIADRLMPRTATTAVPDAAVAEAADDKSIAVLPFADMSQAQDQEYFSDGLSEELLDLLAKIPELRVISRTSSFQFKGENIDVREIAEKLGVATVLEGSVRKAGENIRVTAQLIRAVDGSHLWSDTYTRDVGDIFDLQDDIAGAVVRALKVELLGDALPQRRHTPTPEVHALYLQGRYWAERRSSENAEKATNYLKEALRIDPDYAPAWATLSEVYMNLANYGVEGAVGLGREAAEKAIASDPELADGYVALAYVTKFDEWDWDATADALARAQALDPGSALVLRRLGDLADNHNRVSEAIAWYEKSLARDPLRPGTYANLGLTLTFAGRLDEAEQTYHRMLELDPGYASGGYRMMIVRLLQQRPDAALVEIEREKEKTWRLAGMPLALHALGRTVESDAALDELIDNHADDWAYQIGQIYAYRGETEQAFAWLERAYVQRDGGLWHLAADPLIAELRPDPRFRALVKKIDLVNGVE